MSVHLVTALLNKLSTFVSCYRFYERFFVVGYRRTILRTADRVINIFVPKKDI